MMITVRYGENKKVLINANCKNHILLEHLKEKCDCCYEDVVDLSDESGNIKFLQRNLMDYGCDYLNDRETLILLKVDNEDDRYVYTPLVKELEGDTEFIGKLNPKEAQRTKRGKHRASNHGLEDETTRRNMNGRRSSKGNILQRRKSVSSAPKNALKLTASLVAVKSSSK